MVNKLEKCLHPMLAKRDQNWFCRRIQAEMKRQGLGYLILQTPCNVFYSTGYMPLVGSSAAVVPAEGDVHLIISTLESADAYASTQNGNSCPGCLSTTARRRPAGTRAT